MRRCWVEKCCRNRCNLWRRKTPQTRQLWLSKTASSRLLHRCWLPRHGRVQPDWSNGGRPPVPVCFSDEMRNSRGALTRQLNLGLILNRQPCCNAYGQPFSNTILPEERSMSNSGPGFEPHRPGNPSIFSESQKCYRRLERQARRVQVPEYGLDTPHLERGALRRHDSTRWPAPCGPIWRRDPLWRVETADWRDIFRLGGRSRRALFHTGDRSGADLAPDKNAPRQV